MRKWNDNVKLPLKQQKIYAAAIGGSFLLAFIHYELYGYLSIENIAGMALAGFLVYGIWFGGIYKIARHFAERKARRSDNDWDPFRK